MLNTEIKVGRVYGFDHLGRVDYDLGRYESYKGPGLILEVETVKGGGSGTRPSKTGKVRLRTVVRFMDKLGKTHIVGVKLVRQPLTGAIEQALLETAAKHGIVAVEAPALSVPVTTNGDYDARRMIERLRKRELELGGLLEGLALEIEGLEAERGRLNAEAVATATTIATMDRMLRKSEESPVG